MKWIQKLFVVVGMSSIFGCGTYNKVVYMLPQENDAWEKPRMGDLERTFRCSDGTVNVSPSIAYSRKVARAFFWLPLPATSEDTPIIDIEKPINVSVVFGPNHNIKDCRTDLVWLRGQRSKTDIAPTGVLTNTHNSQQGLHFCLYAFVPVSEIGDEFNLNFSPDVLQCGVKPLRFLKEETTTYFPAFAP